jgi:hypothetical protein
LHDVQVEKLASILFTKVDEFIEAQVERYHVFHVSKRDSLDDVWGDAEFSQYSQLSQQISNGTIWVR